MPKNVFFKKEENEPKILSQEMKDAVNSNDMALIKCLLNITDKDNWLENYNYQAVICFAIAIGKQPKEIQKLVSIFVAADEVINIKSKFPPIICTYNGNTMSSFFIPDENYHDAPTKFSVVTLNSGSKQEKEIYLS